MSPKAVAVSCTGSRTIPLASIKPLQGELKSLSKANYAKLRGLILKNGITAPIHVWTDPKGAIWNLDGHQRAKVLAELGKEGYKIPPVPIVDVKASNIQQAREILLSNVAQFGHVEQEGLYEFMHLAEIKFPDLIGSFDIPNLDLTKFGKGYFEDVLPAEDEAYTKKVESPIYTAKGEKPDLEELVDETKAQELIAEIEKAKIPDDVKAFLCSAATRHMVFNYEAIAEYYCHAPKKVQELMEASALVIIDFKKAIEKGFVVLSDQIAAAYKAQADEK